MDRGGRSRRYRGMSENERRSRRRQRMLAAGTRLFGERGYQNVTVRALCAGAGLTERYFYESFANREVLLCAVYDDVVERIRGRIKQTVATAGGSDTTTTARAALETYFRFLQEEPAAARVLLFEVLGVSAAVDSRYRQAMQDFAELTRQLILPGSRAASRQDMDAMMIDGVVGAIVYIAMRWVLAGYRPTLGYVTESAATIVGAVRAGLTPKAVDGGLAN